MPRTLANDALFGLLLPIWQVVIGALVLIAMAVSVQRLARRGQSRMSAALLIVGGMIVGIAALSMLLGA